MLGFFREALHSPSTHLNFDHASSDHAPKSSPQSSPQNLEACLMKLEIVHLLFKENPLMTPKEGGKKLEISSRTIKKQLAHIKLLGQIVRIGPIKSGHWEILVPGKKQSKLS